MKKRSFAALFIVMLLASGCSSSETSQTEASTQVPTDTADPVAENIPSSVQKTQDGFHAAIQASGFSGFSVGNIIISGDRESYKFCINTPLDGVSPDVRFEASDDPALLSFDVELPEKADGHTLKQLIALSICAASEIDFSDCDSLVEQLVNSYDGSSLSAFVESGDYFFVIKPGYLTLQPYLSVINKSNINQQVDTSIYEGYSSDAMSAPLNQGEKAFLTGVVQASIWSFPNMELEVSSGNDTYIIYANPDHFVSFNIRAQYTFYGVIAKPRNGYSGCLRLEYFETN